MSRTLTLNSVSARTTASLVLAVGLLAGSTGALFIRYAEMEQVSPLFIVATRLVLGAAVLTPLVITRYSADLHALSRRDLCFAGVAGFFQAIQFATFIIALQHMTVLVNQVLTNASPIWVAILEVTFLKGKLTAAIWFGLFLGLGGGLIIALSPSSAASGIPNSTLGIVLSITSSVAGAFYMTIGRKVRAKVAAVPYIWLVYSSAAITATIALQVTHTPITGYTTNGYFWVLMLTLFAQLIGHSAYNYALGYLPATVVSNSSLIIVVNSTILAVLAFHEIPDFWKILGSAAITGGVILVSVAQSRAIFADLPVDMIND